MKISIVLGSQYGDEGKGSITNWLTTQSSNPLVIRFNGGQQASHTVSKDGILHSFSSIGSGALNSVPTYWSKFCTFFPPGFNQEYDALIVKGCRPPKMFIDPLAMLTTPFDIRVNRLEEFRTNHGSVGAGVGKTIWRHETLDHSFRIFAKDLKYEWILIEKLKAMVDLYGAEFDFNIDLFLKEVKIFLERVVIKDSSILHDYEHLIFEGAQGILLDREHGIFPHVTRSHCTSKNAWEILKNEFSEKKIKNSTPEIYYISRCYQTRHGNGPLNGEHLWNESDLICNSQQNAGDVGELNLPGKFRYAPFYFPNINYALETDAQYSSKFNPNINIVVTCLDQVKDKIPILIDDDSVKYLTKNRFLSKLIEILPYNGLNRKIILSSSPDTSKIEIHEL